jgi:hypothetical protein
MESGWPARLASAAVSIARLILVLALALSVTSEAQSARRTKKKPAPVTQPATAPEPEPEPAKPEPTVEAPVRKVVENGTLVIAVARASNAEPAAVQIQAELNRLLGAKPDVQLVELASAFPPPAPASLKPADALYEEGKKAYDNLDPDAAATKFTSAAEAYEKHPGELKPARLAQTFVYLAACQFLNGDKVGAKASFLRALAANPGVQPDQSLFGSDVQTAFVDAQQEFNAEKPGTLVIDSKPSGAQVTVRGEDVGVTPLKSVPVHAGRQPVVISLPGYVPFTSYPQVAPGKSSELKPQLEPLPALAEVLTAASRASTERSFDAKTMPPEVATIADKAGARYVVLAAVQQKKSDPAQAEVQVWDVRTKNRLRGVELELKTKDQERTPAAAADRVYGFLTGKLVAEPSSPSRLPQVVKKPWFWAAVVGGAAVVTGGIVYATQDHRGGSPLGPVTGFPGLGF